MGSIVDLFSLGVYLVLVLVISFVVDYLVVICKVGSWLMRGDYILKLVWIVVIWVEVGGFMCFCSKKMLWMVEMNLVDFLCRGGGGVCVCGWCDKVLWKIFLEFVVWC